MSLAIARLTALARCREIILSTPLMLLLLFTAGCASTRIDWDARVGRYTYDQAVVEMGPPDKTAKLSDNSTVAEWLTSRGMSVGTIYSSGPYSGAYYGRMQTYQTLPGADSFVRLVFNPEGKLTSWKKFTR